MVRIAPPFAANSILRWNAKPEYARIEVGALGRIELVVANGHVSANPDEVSSDTQNVEPAIPISQRVHPPFQRIEELSWNTSTR